MAASKRKKTGSKQATSPVSRKKARTDGKEGAARNAVLNTTELLENILVHLPAKQLYIVQRVSHQFKDAIAGSPDIQRKLWIRVDQAPIPATCNLFVRRSWLNEDRVGVVMRPEDLQKPSVRKRHAYGHLFAGLTPLLLNPALSFGERKLGFFNYDQCDAVIRFERFDIPRGDGRPLWSTTHLCLPVKAPACIRFRWSIKGRASGEGERSMHGDAVTLGAVVRHILDGDPCDMQDDVVRERKVLINKGSSSKGLRHVVERLEEKYKARMKVQWMEIIFHNAVVATEKEWMNLLR